MIRDGSDPPFTPPSVSDADTADGTTAGIDADTSDAAGATFDTGAYLQRIGIDQDAVDEPDLQTLARLQRAHVTSVPFENLAIVGDPHPDAHTDAHRPGCSPRESTGRRNPVTSLRPSTNPLA